ncbi:MAG: hypothetical protein ACREKL_02475 [Chthoniobacterales bacterium]
MRKVFRVLTKAVAAAFLLGIPALLVYLQFVGFGAEWRAEVAQALSGTGYRVEIGRLTFHPFEGIVAEEMKLFRRDATARQLARIDRVTVSPNLAQLLRGKVTIDQLDLENTSVSIPFAQDGKLPDTIELHGIRAEILNANGQLTIAQAECWIGDIHLTLRGNLLNPEIANARRTPSNPEDAAKRATTIRAILHTLDRIHFQGESPELSLTVHGDLLEPETFSADEITFQTGTVSFDDLHFDHVSLLGSYEHRTLRVSSLRGSGPDGNALVAGQWNFATSSGQADISGALRWAPLLILAGRKDLTKEIVFDQPPALRASITAVQGAKGLDVSATGRVATQGFRLKGMTAHSFEAAAAWKNKQLYVQDAVLKSTTGTVRADVLVGAGIFKLNLESEADPNEFIRFFGPKEQAIIGLLKFEDAPKLMVSLDGTRPSLDALTGTGTIELGRAAMRGSWIDFAKSDLVIKDRAILYKDLTIGKGKLRATGSFTYDFGRQEVRLDGIRSNLNPPDMLMWVDPRVAKTVEAYRFRAPPNVRADGLAHMKDPTQNDLHISVDAPGGLTYSLLNKDLVFGAMKATVELKGRRVLANVTQAALYGGEVSVNANVSIDPANPTYRVDATVERVTFPSLTELYFGYAKSEGALSGTYGFDADLKNPAAMRGSGSLRVEDGHVMAIPLFGPLSLVISAVIPGAGHETARLATMDFTVSDQHIYTKNLDIQGAGFELFGDGSVAFPSGKLDMTVRINARGIPGIVLFAVSKLMEYVSTGTMSEPDWRPKIIPREFFDVLGMGGGDAEPKAPPAKKPPQPRPLR